MSAERFMEDGKWKCIKCGSCCRIAGMLIPEWDRGDGACHYLTEDNQCSIYAIRPQVCRRRDDFKLPDLVQAELCDRLDKHFSGESPR